MHYRCSAIRFPALCVTLMVLFLLVGCSSDTTTTNTTATPTGATTPTIVSPTSRGITPTSATTTLPVPPTQTNCPPTGVGRAMIIAPLVLDNHQNVVYTLNQGTYDAPVQGKLLRYDVTTGKETLIVTLPHAHFYQAQLSTDGQWVLFVNVTGANGRISQLQMIRLDGQGLQTLYCTPDYGIQQTQWSYDQSRLVFYNLVNTQGVIYLLDMRSGTVQTLLTAPPQVGLVIRTWLDASRLYVTDTAIDTIHSSIYLLDLNKGMNQTLAMLTYAVRRNYGDFDSSDDGAHLLISYGGCQQNVCSGPSSIGVQPLSGGQQRTIYTSQFYDVIQVRVLNHTSMLFLVGNSVSAGNTEQDGLWKINIDGSGMTRLLTITVKQFSYFNYRTQALWANVSRDGSMYILQVNGFQGTTQTNSLVLGGIDGGPTHVVATTQDGSELAVVGWTA